MANGDCRVHARGIPASQSAIRTKIECRRRQEMTEMGLRQPNIARPPHPHPAYALRDRPLDARTPGILPRIRRAPFLCTLLLQCLILRLRTDGKGASGMFRL